MSCPTAPFPGLIKGSAGHQFALAATILFPLYIVFATLVFYSRRQTSVFLRKRSIPLLLLGAVGTVIPWACTTLYDYIGSENFPCGIFIFLVYASNSAVSYPLVLKIATYQNQVALFRLGREMQDGNTGILEGLLAKDPLSGEFSLRTLAAHIRIVFCMSRSKSDRVLNAKFSRTYGLNIIWFILTSFPFYLVYVIRLGMNPQWNTCTGCEIEPFDAAANIAIATAALLMSAFANIRVFTSRAPKRDALRIVRECMTSWMLGGFFYNLSFILFLIDPGNVYKQGLFNWRFVKLIATGLLYHVQTIHQVFVSGRLRREVVLAPNLDQGERFAEVMYDKELRSKLLMFLDAELSSEVIKFLTAVEEYKRIYGQERCQSLGRQIFSTFIVRGAPLEINISSGVRSKLLYMMPPGNFPQDIFDIAYQEVKRNFLEDGFARFIRKLEKEQQQNKDTGAILPTA